MTEENKRQIKCQRCGYEWITTSEMIYVSCPNCQTKVKTKQIFKENMRR